MFPYFSYIVGIVLSTPLVSLAASVSTPTNLKGFIALITGIIGKLVVLIFALTFLAFMWGIIKNWIINGGDAAKVETGKKIFSTAVIVLVIMISVWGILRLLQRSVFGI